MMTDTGRHREIEWPDDDDLTAAEEEAREESAEVREERAEHQHEVALLDAPDRFPWDVLLVWTTVLAGVLYLAISILRAVL